MLAQVTCCLLFSLALSQHTAINFCQFANLPNTQQTGDSTTTYWSPQLTARQNTIKPGTDNTQIIMPTVVHA